MHPKLIPCIPLPPPKKIFLLHEQAAQLVAAYREHSRRESLGLARIAAHRLATLEDGLLNAREAMFAAREAWDAAVGRTVEPTEACTSLPCADDARQQADLSGGTATEQQEEAAQRAMKARACCMRCAAVLVSVTELHTLISQRGMHVQQSNQCLQLFSWHALCSHHLMLAAQYAGCCRGGPCHGSGARGCRSSSTARRGGCRGCWSCGGNVRAVETAVQCACRSGRGAADRLGLHGGNAAGK
jgi:hypothetical protein